MLVLSLIALCANAQIEWKSVSPSMTTVPGDYNESTTRDDAKAWLDYDMMTEGAVYGPCTDGKYSVIHWDSEWSSLVDEQLAWEDITGSDLMYVYPAKAAEKSTELTLDENSSESINSLFEDDDTFTKVTLIRHFDRFLADGTTKRWHTIAIPFAMNAEQIASNFGAGAKIMEYQGVENDVFAFKTATDIIYGGFYLVQLGDVEADVESISVSGSVTMSELYGKFGEDYNLVVATNPTTVDNMVSTCYALINNTLKYVDDEENLKATQWYIESFDETAKNVSLSFDGVATSISAISEDAIIIRKTFKDNKIVIKNRNKTYHLNGVETK